MNSYQIKLALTDSDLPAPPLHIPLLTGIPRVHTPAPLSLLFCQHLSCYPSFDISALSVMLEVLLSAEVLQWYDGGSSKFLAGPRVNSHRGPECFLMLQRFSCVATEKGSFIFTKIFTKCYIVGFSFFGKILHLTCREKNLKCTRCKFKISKTLNPLWHALEHITRVIFTYFDRSFAKKNKEWEKKIIKLVFISL